MLDAIWQIWFEFSGDLIRAQSPKDAKQKMKRRLLVKLLRAVCWFQWVLVSATGQFAATLGSEIADVTPETSASGGTSTDMEAINYGPQLSDLINASRAKYLEGSASLKNGDLGKAKEAFDKAVDLVLRSNWEITSTPVLHRYFQDLIHQIQRDESRYLYEPYSEETEEETENPMADILRDIDSIPITLPPEYREALAADLAKTKYEIPITINEMVLRSLNFWLSRGRKVFEDGLVRSGQYRPMIEQIFMEESIPLDILYLAQVESLFQPHAVSKAKAKGIWQFEKQTAIRYGLKVTRDVDERSDPEKSTRAAARYLKDLYAMFKDWNLVLAAYNWGEGKIQRLIKKTGIMDFWQLAEQNKTMPSETRNHVPLIQASVILGRNPEQYGMTTELAPPLKYTEVSVSKPIELRSIAKLLNTSIDELKRLNPSLKALHTPVNYPNFQLKIPVDSPPEIEEKLAALPAARIRVSPESHCRHKIKSGETLTKIAARYNTTVSSLRRANDLSPNAKLIAGSWIRLPSCTAPFPESHSAPKAVSGKSRSLHPKAAQNKPVHSKVAKPVSQKSPDRAPKSPAVREATHKQSVVSGKIPVR